MTITLAIQKSRYTNANVMSNQTTRIASILIFQLTFFLLALTGFVCTHKIQAEEECLSSNIICYECDSRYDPNCADPFDLSSAALESSSLSDKRVGDSSISSDSYGIGDNRNNSGNNQTLSNQLATNNETPILAVNSTIPTLRQPKKLPAISVCHGCCVKITSRTLEGVTYVKRTCTTSLQINFFMVGLVCMKESGDRGKMCFCETDYCNGQLAKHLPGIKLMIILIVAASISQSVLVSPTSLSLLSLTHS